MLHEHERKKITSVKFFALWLFNTMKLRWPNVIASVISIFTYNKYFLYGIYGCHDQAIFFLCGFTEMKIFLSSNGHGLWLINLFKLQIYF